MRELIKRLSPKSLIACYKALRYGAVTVQMFLYRIVPIQRKRVVLTNVWGFGDNIRYVTEELSKRHTSLELIFICNHPRPHEVPEGVRVLKSNTPKAILALATARVWVECNRKEGYIKKRKGQYYIQLWHGGLALKKIEGDCSEFLGETYIKRAKKDTEMTNLYVSNGDFCTQMYRRAFWYTGEILECGSPRMDYLLSKEAIDVERIKQTLGVPFKNRIAIYAPTYRNGNDLTMYELDYQKLRYALSERFGGEWSILVRLHPLAAKLSSQLQFTEQVFDESHYKDLYELMKCSDVLITDYSNIMFEFAYMNRPVFLYAKDLKEYTDDRGFYFEYEKLPFPIACSMEQLNQAIVTFDQTKEEQRVRDFFAVTGIRETGYAAAQVADRIIKETEE